MRNQELLSLVAARFAADAPRNSRRMPVGGSLTASPRRVCDARPCHWACAGSGDVQGGAGTREGDEPLLAVLGEVEAP